MHYPTLYFYILLCALVVALLMSAVFVFHWKQYARGARAVSLAALVYFGVLAFLFVHIFWSYQALA